MLYTLSICNFIYQLHLNKAERKTAPTVSEPDLLITRSGELIDPIGYLGLAGGAAEVLGPGNSEGALIPGVKRSGRLREKKGHGFGTPQDLGLKTCSGHFPVDLRLPLASDSSSVGENKTTLEWRLGQVNDTVLDTL